MTRDEYIQAVRRILDEHTERAASALAQALAIVPKKATKVALDIFVDQDGEGFLDVQVGLEGPDLYVLNRAIASYAALFDTRMTEQGLVPNLPLMDPDDADFSVQDILTDCAASWLKSVWAHTEHSCCQLPVVITSPEGYGTTVPCQLSP